MNAQNTALLPRNGESLRIKNFNYSHYNSMMFIVSFYF